MVGLVGLELLERGREGAVRVRELDALGRLWFVLADGLGEGDKGALDALEVLVDVGVHDGCEVDGDLMMMLVLVDKWMGGLNV